MFIRASSLLLPVVALSSVVAAAPAAIAARDNSCSSGTLQCCNTVMDSTSSSAGVLAGLLGIVSPLLGPLMGVNCSPITGVGVGTGANCVQQTVCCQNTQFNGLINIGCIAININL
ncbi:fungal hydrophobin-domain-containing protein [Scleroderma yunnanense]